MENRGYFFHAPLRSDIRGSGGCSRTRRMWPALGNIWFGASPRSVRVLSSTLRSSCPHRLQALEWPLLLRICLHVFPGVGCMRVCHRRRGVSKLPSEGKRRSSHRGATEIHRGLWVSATGNGGPSWIRVRTAPQDIPYKSMDGYVWLLIYRKLTKHDLELVRSSRSKKCL